MSMEIIRESQLVEVEGYDLCFVYKNNPHAGFSFPCDKDGVCFTNEMSLLAQKNLERCLTGEYEVIQQGVRYWSHSYQKGAQGRCSCNRILELLDFTNVCECGLAYNMSGQLLAPRSQWEKDY